MDNKPSILAKNFFLKLIMIICYFIIVIGSETIYRDRLFEISINHQVNLTKQYSDFDKHIIFNTFKFFTALGTMPFFISMFVIIFIFFPLNRPYLYMSNLFHSYYWVNLLKIIYMNPRPFWTNSDIKNVCNGGFGNPSGHAFCSTSVFLTTALIVTQYKYFKNRLLLKIMIYFFFISIIFLIIASRLILGAHSYNQLLYGSLLGLGNYYIHCHLFNLNKINPNTFFSLFKERTTNAFFLIKYIIMFSVLLLIYFTSHEKIKLRKGDWLPIVEKCNKKEYRMFENDGLFNALALVSLIGMHIGLIYFINFIYKEKGNIIIKEIDVYNWSFNYKKKYTLIIKLIFVIIGGAPLSLYLLIPSGINLVIIYLFKVGIPFLLSTMLIFGPCSKCFIYYRYARESIYISDDQNVKMDAKIQ